MEKMRAKFDSNTLELMDKFEFLEDQYYDLDENEWKGNKGRKFERRMFQIKDKLLDKNARQLLEEHDSKDPDIERLIKATKKYSIYKKSYEIDPRAGEQRTW